MANYKILKFIEFSKVAILFAITALWLACNQNSKKHLGLEPSADQGDFYRGADLSYVNEMEDCGVTYYNQTGNAQDPYSIFAEAGTNLVRLRLWHRPHWTRYSTLSDVEKSIQRAKANKMKVLLDFHYSDDWADPQKQVVPAAWQAVVNNPLMLGDSIYTYTFSVLKHLHEKGLMPEMVQIGNEINIEILQDTNKTYNKINWERNVDLLNRGIQAVTDVNESLSVEVETMIHIAQPENALWWFREAFENGLNKVDWIGLSYYPKWSSYGLDSLPVAINDLIESYQTPVMVVETAYPFTLENVDKANNILGRDAALPAYEISPSGQLSYLLALEDKIKEGGGHGLIYWEPAWVSNDCNTRWGQGSHWENATLFDLNNRAHQGLQYYQQN